MTRLGGLLPPILGLALATLYYAVTYNLPLESRIFPQTVLAPVVVFGLILLVRQLRVPEAATESRTDGQRSQAPAVFALSVGFVAGFAYLGFVAAAFLFLVASLRYLRNSWLMSLAVAVGVTGGYYLIFVVLLGMSL